jgi:hypothetical protein
MIFALIIMSILISVVDGGYLGWLLSAGRPEGMLIGITTTGIIFCFAFYKFSRY